MCVSCACARRSSPWRRRPSPSESRATGEPARLTSTFLIAKSGGSVFHLFLSLPSGRSSSLEVRPLSTQKMRPGSTPPSSPWGSLCLGSVMGCRCVCAVRVHTYMRFCTRPSIISLSLAQIFCMLTDQFRASLTFPSVWNHRRPLLSDPLTPLPSSSVLQMMNKVFGGSVHKKSVREDGVFNVGLDNTCSLFRCVGPSP